MRRIFLTAMVLFLAGCAAPRADVPFEQAVAALLPADVFLIGEQHDAPDHQRLHRDAVLMLSQGDRLAALALEMAESGRSTLGLPATATEQQVKTALAWKDGAWPWSAYGPVVMAAVQSGKVVAGANLPSNEMRAAMADPGLDARLSPQALSAQQVAIREGHCGLLPESQIGPMTRIQIARDMRMAQTAQSLIRPGKTVLLIAGAGHVLADRGIPRHLGPEWTARSLLLRAGSAGPESPAVDAVVATAPIPPVDYCESLRRRQNPTAAAPVPPVAGSGAASR